MSPPFERRLRRLALTRPACPTIRSSLSPEEQARRFRDDAPTTAAQAATIILDGVKAEKWRILVGKDAEFLDAKVRAAPEDAYSPAFYEGLSGKQSGRFSCHRVMLRSARHSWSTSAIVIVSNRAKARSQGDQWPARR